jgi:hypothetical protein
MSEFLKSTLHKIHEDNPLTRSWKSGVPKDFIGIQKKGYQENSYAGDWQGRVPDGYKETYKDRKLVKVPIFKLGGRSKPILLLNSLRDYETAVQSFALKENIPFTNNKSERDSRIVKLKENIYGCFRSPEMAKSFLRLRSYLSTMTKQFQPRLESLILVEICCEPAQNLGSRSVQLLSATFLKSRILKFRSVDGESTNEKIYSTIS